MTFDGFYFNDFTDETLSRHFSYIRCSLAAEMLADRSQTANVPTFLAIRYKDS